MNYIKFDTIESTNEFLKSYAKNNNLPNLFYVLANEQTGGKGQRLNSWHSDCCKNILISYFIKKNIPVQEGILLNQIVSISVVELLEKFNIPEIKIKEPNDILSGYYKIAGILIENAVSKKLIKNSIIGIGLNVNQDKFPNLPFATSMKKLTRQEFELELLIDELTKLLDKNFKMDPEVIKRKFQAHLMNAQSEKIIINDED
jgi:BirA family biotin operon repressor/biotin-[acetyl-CoA-carboxylase] ligase